MLRNMSSAVLETRCGDVEEHQPTRIRKRSRVGPYRESEGSIASMNIGHTELIDADISKYFDTIPHSNLMAVVAERICDGAILHLLQMWLKAPIMEVDGDGTRRNIGGGKGNSKGTPQGGVISPLLSNLYLHILDRIWERGNLQQLLGARLAVWPLPKSDGQQRPIGIAALEDKVIQQALTTILQQIYEEDFLDFSYGSRPGRSQHNALDSIYVAITQKKVNWVSAGVKVVVASVEIMLP